MEAGGEHFIPVPEFAPFHKPTIEVGREISSKLNLQTKVDAVSLSVTIVTLLIAKVRPHNAIVPEHGSR